MARRLPTTNTVWVLVCPSCKRHWGSVLGRGRWYGHKWGWEWAGPLGRPQYEPLTRGRRWEVLPPARKLERRIQCARCFMRTFLPRVLDYPGVRELLDVAVETGDLDDLDALRRHVRASIVEQGRADGRWPQGPTCGVCGVQLGGVAWRRSRRYCSNACRVKAHRLRTRWYKLLQLGPVARLTGTPKAAILRATEAGELRCYQRGDRRYWRAVEVLDWRG